MSTKWYLLKSAFILSLLCFIVSGNWKQASAQMLTEAENSSVGVYNVETQKTKYYQLPETNLFSIKQTTPQPAQSSMPCHTMTPEEQSLMEEADSTLPETDAVSAARATGLSAVTNMNQFPYYCTCRIVAYFYTPTETTISQGTGFAAGGNLCATARHVITDDNGNFPNYLIAYYGYNNNTYVFKIDDPKEYIFSSAYAKGNYKEDYAFIVWNNFGSANTGNYGMIDKPEIGLAVQSNGYPREDGYNGEVMYWGAGNIVSKSSMGSDDLESCFAFDLLLHGGQSGSPVYIDEGYGPYAIGIYTDRARIEFENVIKDQFSIARRITSSLISWLQQYNYI